MSCKAAEEMGMGAPMELALAREDSFSSSSVSIQGLT